MKTKLRDRCALMRGRIGAAILLGIAAVAPAAILLGIAAVAPAVAGEPDWQLVTEQAQWRARDSQGEVVFNDQLWIFGGWYDSNSAPPRDVWNSKDGKTWTLVTENAPWRHSDLPMTTVFDGRMWLMGGWVNGRLPDASGSNEVWSSVDGKDWKQATGKAGWSPRLGSAIAVFRDKMWILGGNEQYYYGDEKTLKNDVWSSSDGVTWTQVTANAGWSPRAFHQAVVLNDKLYVMGGGNYSPYYAAHNDVWSTSDGEHWEQVTSAAEWDPRIWFSTVVYRDRMWVLGGWSNNPSRNWGDTWYSKDGKQWHQLKTAHGWIARHEQSALVMNDKIWVAGGMIWPLKNDVWTLSIPESFFDD